VLRSPFPFVGRVAQLAGLRVPTVGAVYDRAPFVESTKERAVIERVQQIDEVCESGDIPLLREEGWLRQ